MPVASSSIGPTLYIFSAPKFCLCFCRLFIFATAAAPLIVIAVAASSDITPATTPSGVVPVGASPNVALASAPFACSSALPPTVPVLPIFGPLLLALSEFIYRPLNIKASAVNPVDASRHICSYQTLRNGEFADLQDCFDSREVDLQELTAEAQSLTEQITNLCNQDVQGQQLLDARANQSMSLQRKFVKVCAPPLKLIDSLIAKLRKYNQL